MSTNFSQLTIACLLLASPLAHAQANRYQGFGASLSLNPADSVAEATLHPSGNTYAGSDRDTNLQLRAQYNWALNDRYTVGLGVSTALGKLKAGTLNFNAGTPIAIKESYSLFLTPGYAIDKDWMVYGKVAYAIAKTEASGAASTSFDGYGLGMGLQLLLTPNWYLQAEFLSNHFNDSSDAVETDKLKSNNLSLGVGYRF